MLDLQCPGGITLTGADDEMLFRLGRAQADSHRPGEVISDAFTRNPIAAQAVGAVWSA